MGKHTNKYLYLLEDTTEAKELVEKIKLLLETGEVANIELAFQLLKGGGVHPSLLTHLWAIKEFTDEKNIQKQTKRLLQKIIPKTIQATKLKKFQRYSSEVDIFQYLEQFENIPEFNSNNLANLCLKFTKKGGKYCLEKQTDHNEMILRQIMDGSYLSLRGFELTSLPAEIGKLTNLFTLDLEWNKLTDIPDEIQQLTNLSTLYINKNDVTPIVLEKLEKFFPKIFAEKNYQEAWNFVYDQEFEKALTSIEKAIVLDSQNHLYWDGKSWILGTLRRYDQALECTDKAIELTENLMEKTLYMVNKGSKFQRMGRKEDAEKIAIETLELLKAIPKNTWNVSCYFTEGLANSLSYQYEKAYTAYDKAIQLNEYYGSGVSWYNKACAFAHQNRKQEMLDALREAFKIDRQLWAREAPVDNDFEYYWEDEDFKAFLTSNQTF